MIGFILIEELKYVRSGLYVVCFFKFRIFVSRLVSLKSFCVFLMLSLGNLVSLFFKMFLIILGVLYFWFNFFYRRCRVFDGLFVLVVWIFKVYELDFGFSYFIKRLSCLKLEICKLVRIFLKFDFYMK